VTCGDGTNTACTLQEIPATEFGEAEGKTIYQKFCDTFNDQSGDKLGCHYDVNPDTQIPLLRCFCNTDLCNKEKDYGMDTPKPNDAVGTRNTLSTGLCILVCFIVAATASRSQSRNLL